MTWLEWITLNKALPSLRYRPVSVPQCFIPKIQLWLIRNVSWSLKFQETTYLIYWIYNFNAYLRDMGDDCSMLTIAIVIFTILTFIYQRSSLLDSFQKEMQNKFLLLDWLTIWALSGTTLYSVIKSMSRSDMKYHIHHSFYYTL